MLWRIQRLSEGDAPAHVFRGENFAVLQIGKRPDEDIYDNSMVWPSKLPRALQRKLWVAAVSPLDASVEAGGLGSSRYCPEEFLKEERY